MRQSSISSVSITRASPIVSKVVTFASPMFTARWSKASSSDRSEKLPGHSRKQSMAPLPPRVATSASKSTGSELLNLLDKQVLAERLAGARRYCCHAVSSFGISGAKGIMALVRGGFAAMALLMGGHFAFAAPLAPQSPEKLRADGFVSLFDGR